MAAWQHAVMGTEIELKFRIPAARLAALRRAVDTARAVREPLAAVYFDTPGEDLAQARVALRLRREGRGWVQTLKAEAGSAMQRLEHNVALDADGDAPPPLDLARHAGSAAGAALQRVLAAAGAGGAGGAAALQPHYATAVQRTRRVLRAGAARIELALDEGELRSGERRLPIREIEFELLDGPVAALLDLAGRWADRFGLVLDVRSKSERGHLLAVGRAASPPARGRPLRLPDTATPAQAVAAMLGSALQPALANASVLADPDTAAAVAGEPEYLHQLRVALRRLRSVLRLWGPLAPEAAALAPALAALFAALGAVRDEDVLAGTLWPALQAAGAPPIAWPTPAAAAAGGDRGGGGGDSVARRLAAPSTQRLWLALLGASHAEVAAPAAADRADGRQADAKADARAQAKAQAKAARRAARQGDGRAVAAPAEALRPALRAPLRRLLRQVRRDVAAIATLDDAARHRLRRRIKRLRYGTELSAALWPAKACAGFVAALQAAQGPLGDDNDARVALQRCRALAAQQPTAWFAVGWLAARRQVLAPACAEALAALAAVPAPWRRAGGARRVAVRDAPGRAAKRGRGRRG